VLEGELRLREGDSWTLHVGHSCRSAKLAIASHYHKSGDFQDNTANREFFGLTQDWAFRSWGISAVRFSGYYGIILNLAVLEIISCYLEFGTE
jgi:hypothetical protein